MHNEEEDKYAEFEDIQQDPKAHTLDGLVEILQIIKKYPGSNVQAEHDVIYLNMNYNEEVSREDAKRLYELGAFFSDESDGWQVFA